VTIQEIFDKIYNGLKSQGFCRSIAFINGEEKCAYRGENGLKCAAGHLITDECYTSLMEGKAIQHPEPMKALECSIGEVDEDARCLIRGLQSLHDSCTTSVSMKDLLIRFAERNYLTIPRDE